MRTCLLVLIVATTALRCLAAEPIPAWRCTDGKSVIYTNQRCPAGWIEVIGDHRGDIRKLQAPVAKSTNENTIVEESLRSEQEKTRRVSGQ